MAKLARELPTGQAIEHLAGKTSKAMEAITLEGRAGHSGEGSETRMPSCIEPKGFNPGVLGTGCHLPR